MTTNAAAWAASLPRKSLLSPATVETPRLLLRPMCSDDVEPMLALFGDPRFMAAFDASPFDEAQTRAWVERNLEHQERHGFGLFTIVERSTGEVIGDCGFEVMELEGMVETELGYDLRADRWGQGLATEAASAAIAFADSDLGLRRLVSLVREGNDQSARVAERIGMALERTLDRDGVTYRHYALELGRSDRHGCRSG